MRVIEEKPYGFEFTCKGCGSKLAADANDVVRGEFGVRDDFDIKYYVTCPVCGKLHFPDQNTIPPAVVELADQKQKR